MTIELMFWIALAVFGVLWVAAAIFDGAVPLAALSALRSYKAERPTALAPIDPVDADETNHGPCAQGDCSDE